LLDNAGKKTNKRALYLFQVERMIPFHDLKREYENLKPRIDGAIQRVFQSGSFILGEELRKFEREFASYSGAHDAVGVNSGSDALFLAVHGLGIKKGDHVLTPSYTFTATVDAIVRNGATPVFVDIDERTYCIDPMDIEEKITPRTKAIIPVHIHGHPADMGAIMDIARDHSLRVIEDACQAHGATCGGIMAGTIGDVGCFSFYPTKNLGGCGDGGMVVSMDRELSGRIRALRNYGRLNRLESRCIGINSRLDELQAAVLREKLPFLDRWNTRRREIAARYTACLSGTDLALPREYYGSHVWHHYVVRSRTRDSMRTVLHRTAESVIHYPVPVHLQKAYAHRGRWESLSVTERITPEIFSLPLNPWMTDAEVNSISEALCCASEFE
jgi:dTDP-4-amino-4,6-dideoxygalactose transaminase